MSDQDAIRHFVWLPLLLLSHGRLVLGSKVEERKGEGGGRVREFLLNAIIPPAIVLFFVFFQAMIATTRLSSWRHRGQRRAGWRPEQCHNRLSLNHASIRIHRLQERCSGEGGTVGGRSGWGYVVGTSKQTRAGASSRNAPMAETVKQRLRDNLGEIFERRCSGVCVATGGRVGECSVKKKKI